MCKAVRFRVADVAAAIERIRVGGNTPNTHSLITAKEVAMATLLLPVS
jgi:Mg-chelatase subunit ChlD